MKDSQQELSEAYRLMAADEARETEAQEWAEVTCLDVGDDVTSMVLGMVRNEYDPEPMSTGADHDVFFVPSQFPTIQQAVDAVIRPATIMISPGAYAEDIRIVGKGYLVIESTRLSRRGVTLTGGGEASVMVIEGSVVHLSGIEIRSRNRARGILAVDAALSLQECVLAGNGAGGELSGAGMLCRRSSVRVQKSTIAGNTVDCSGSGGGGGLHLIDCRTEIAGSSIQTNAVYASGVARGGGIWCEGGRMRMWRSRVTDNALSAKSCEGAGIYFASSIGAQIGGSVITGNGSVEGRGGGVFVCGNIDQVVIHRNTVVRQNHPTDFDSE